MRGFNMVATARVIKSQRARLDPFSIRLLKLFDISHFSFANRPVVELNKLERGGSDPASRGNDQSEQVGSE